MRSVSASGEAEPTTLTVTVTGCIPTLKASTALAAAVPRRAKTSTALLGPDAARRERKHCREALDDEDGDDGVHARVDV